MGNVINLKGKKFQFTNAQLVDDQLVLTLQYGGQTGQLSIDAKHRYKPENLYEFVDMIYRNGRRTCLLNHSNLANLMRC